MLWKSDEHDQAEIQYKVTVRNKLIQQVEAEGDNRTQRDVRPVVSAFAASGLSAATAGLGASPTAVTDNTTIN